MTPEIPKTPKNISKILLNNVNSFESSH